MITSINNPKVQYVRMLLAQKKERDKEKCFVVEGVRLAEEALQAGLTPTLILYSSSLSERGQQALADLQAIQAESEEMDAGLLDRVSATETSQGLLAVFRQPVSPGERGEPVLVLDQMRDPGNLGTILRGAAAFGFPMVILTPGSADPYSPKTLRAGMGAQFKLSIEYMSAEEIHCMAQARAAGKLQILLAEMDTQQVCWESDLSKPLCLIIGGEAFGVEPEIRKITDGSVLIPMQANNESLNAAMAASILMYEVYRQRKTK